ncbi:MAG: hypothetical protein AAGH89_04105 [Verrucomicrobiota bacterium]
MRIPLVLAFVGWLNLISVVFAQDDRERQLRIQVEWIEMMHANFDELMSSHGERDESGAISSNDGALRVTLGKMIESGDAVMLETAVILTRSGQRAKTEAIREMIYPTEFKAPGWEQALDEKGEEKGEGEAEVEPNLVALGPPIPSAFETRNIGTTLEVDTVLGADGKTIDLNISPEIVYFTGTAEHVSRRGEETIEVAMPLFYSMRLITAATVRVGEFLLLGTTSPPDADSGETDRSRKVLIFVKADVLVVGK